MTIRFPVLPVAALAAALLPAIPAEAADCALPRAADFAVTVELTAFGGEAHGSGFVWDATGRVVTNHHVVAAGSAPRLTYADGARVSARVVADSPDADLAILEPVGPVPPRRPAERADAVPGQRVVALGNPGGRGLTRSEGAVTALGRLVDSGGTLLPDMIETTVPLVPGNSGGPLFDCDGRFVGLNAAAVLTPGGTQAAYSIPAATVARVAGRMLAENDTGGDIDTEIAAASPPVAAPPQPPRLGILVTPVLGGLAVVGVTPGAPAERAGLRIGDIIRRIDTRVPADPQEVPLILARVPYPGAVPVAIDRNGFPMALTVEMVSG